MDTFIMYLLTAQSSLRITAIDPFFIKNFNTSLSNQQICPHTLLSAHLEDWERVSLLFVIKLMLTTHQYEWLKQLSQDPNNTVIGLVRNVDKVQAKLEADNVKNVYLLQADMVDHQALNTTAIEAAKITPSIDYLIVNGALVDISSQSLKPTDFIGREEELRNHMIASLDVNVLGVMYSINAFLPLVRKGAVKKITVISTGMADADMVVKGGVASAVIYASMKAATNMVVAKYAAELKSEEITLLALSPGLVNTRQTQR